ncbi:MAG: NAD(P)-dependent oxidoreductase [Candidatus Eremiobacterota bacterium]
MNIAIEGIIKFNQNHIKKLNNCGKIIYYPKNLPSDDFFKLLKNCEIITVDKTFYNNLIPELKKLKLISVYATGYEFIDIKLAKKYGITVCNVPDYSSDAVAEHIFAMILTLSKKLQYMEKEMRKGLWWTDLEPVAELKGKTIGIIGYGNTGRRIEKIAKAFGMNIIINTKNPGKYRHIKTSSLEELLKKSDIITLNLPLNNETKHLIDRDKINLMKREVLLINCARGPVVNEKDIITALKEKRIKGAAFDVFEKEPLPKESELFDLENIILTPHTAFYTEEAMERLKDICMKNIISFLKGKPVNVVNV